MRSPRAEEIFNSSYQTLAAKTDRMFAWLFAFQWLLGVFLAATLSGNTWEGNQSQTHPHVFFAVFWGAALAAFPIFLALSRPGAIYNRYVTAISQMLFSTLFIHVTGGRIETHFHVFGSLAFLAFYRDFRPLILATIVTSVDHLMRGIFLPESVYGVLAASPMRALEHAGWVIFEDIFLFISIKNGLEELRNLAQKQAELESTLAGIEATVQERTRELKQSKETVVEQQQILISSTKMTALGEMAGGVAHEINTPLAVIGMRIEQIDESLKDGTFQAQQAEHAENIEVIKRTVDRIAKIVGGLRFFAREGKRATTAKVPVANLIEDTLSFCKERFSNHGVQLTVGKTEVYQTLQLDCRAVEISQVILNLLNNAYDAACESRQKWVRIDVADKGDIVEIAIMDSGKGIPREIQDKMMQPFFTTKPVGKGTGLGLSISKGIIESHHGQFYLDNECANTRFVICLPKNQNSESLAA